MTDYRALNEQLAALLSGETDRIANLANAAALVYHALPEVNWAGFYLRRDRELVLGPFQGQPACVRIPLGQGVCGTAARDDRTLRVADVHAFPGHIACDAASRSEIVIPLHGAGGVVAVLDIDSPRPDRFSAADEAGLETMAKTLERKVRLAD
ncbi:MAG: GAF domain-containing protein [Pseudomonadota bacterium]